MSLARRTNWTRISLAAVCFAIMLGQFASVAAAPRISTKKIYFTVEGNTPAELINSILSRGPGGNSGVAMATTQANISQTLKPRGKTGCRYSSKAVITMRLPKLSASSRKSKAVRSEWKKFSRYIHRHEAYHRSVYIGCARKIDTRARAHIRKNGCKNARAKMTAIMHEERARCDRLNMAYDRRERSRIKQLGLVKKGRPSGIGGIVFGTHGKKDSKNLAPNRN